MKPASAEPLPQVVFGAQITNRSEVDAFIAISLHGVEHADRIGHMGIDADGDFEGAERDRRTRNGDRSGQICGPRERAMD